MMDNTVKKKDCAIKTRQEQQGVVLAVALIMLVLLTLLGISAMRSTIMEERMASNSRNDNIAFQLAETTLRQAEAILLADPQAVSILSASTQAVGLGVCEISLNSEDFTDQARWDAIACGYVGDADVGITRTPHFFVEFVRAEPPAVLGTSPPRECFYRVTARGYGPDANSAVTLQSTYKFNACS
jgi:type IV pilus assembly protein PilX